MAEQPPDPIAASRIPTNLADEMQQSYMAYAMSVIIGRALPDVRDGFKPANRRVLYGMQQMGLQPGRPYKKSAKIVGEVMGNYHPHGGDAIYVTTYDDSSTEPSVLPTPFPNLLVNGAAGIAVGMATNIPPHNLGEVVDALLLLIEKPEVELRELIEVLPGPDFPTAGA